MSTAAHPEPAAVSPLYYLLRNGSEAEEGPYTIDDLRRMRAAGQLEGDVLFATVNSEKWEPVQSLDPELFKPAEPDATTQPPPPKSVSRLIDCPDCGREVSKRAAACPHCGAPLKQKAAPVAVSPPHVVVQVAPPKSRGIYIILGLFFGTLGIHNFYSGRIKHGAWQLILTFSSIILILPVFVVFIWVLIELFAVAEDGNGNKMS